VSIPARAAAFYPLERRQDVCCRDPVRSRAPVGRPEAQSRLSGSADEQGDGVAATPDIELAQYI
jgi:hypothetical protein